MRLFRTTRSERMAIGLVLGLLAVATALLFVWRNL